MYVTLIVQPGTGRILEQDYALFVMLNVQLAKYQPLIVQLVQPVELPNLS